MNNKAGITGGACLEDTHSFHPHPAVPSSIQWFCVNVLDPASIPCAVIFGRRAGRQSTLVAALAKELRPIFFS